MSSERYNSVKWKYVYEYCYTCYSIIHIGENGVSVYYIMILILQKGTKNYIFVMQQRC